MTPAATGPPRRCLALLSTPTALGIPLPAGLTFGLAQGHSVQEAAVLGARCGAAVVTGRGPYAGQIREGP